MGKWDQGEYNRVCNDKFKRLFYIAQGKGAIDYDVDMERDWNQLIKNLDPEKKTVQACFTSLVNATKAPICPRHHLHRAGPSVIAPRAYRHYDTSNARTTRRIAIQRQSDAPEFDDDDIIETNGRYHRMGPLHLRDGPPQAPEQSFPSYTQVLNDNRRRTLDRLQNGFPRGYDWTTDRLPSPPPVFHPDDQEARPPSPPHVYHRGTDTPLSLSGTRGAEDPDPFFHGILPPHPHDFNPFIATGQQFGQAASNDAVDGINTDTTYPLFAPLDDAGPYPNEDIFDTNHEDEDEDDDEALLAEPFYTAAPRAPNTADQVRGYTNWSPPRPPGTYWSLGQDLITDIGVDLEPSSPLSYTSSGNINFEYSERARREIDQQVALDADPFESEATILPGRNPAVWSSYSSNPSMPRRRRREDDGDDTDAQWGVAGFDTERRPSRRARVDEEAGMSATLAQRIRRSIPVSSLLSASGSGSGDNRRNGLVFDAESYINPDL